MRRLIFLFFFLLSLSGLAQPSGVLQSGPMLAYSTMREVLVWVQTKQNATVQIEYWSQNAPATVWRSTIQSTVPDNGFVAHVVLSQLEPGTRYGYRLLLNNKKVEGPGTWQFQTQTLWQWRTDAPDFSFIAGSCAYINEEAYDRPNKPYGGDYQVFESIAAQKSDFMLWLGDNAYLREADWDSHSGIVHRFTHTRSTPQMQAMWASMHHYGIWDDHDYGPNDSDRSYPMKRHTQEVFRSFFPAPNYVFEEGVTSFFQWADCDFFLLDNRFWRTPNNRSDLAEHQILGQPQIEWLIDALANSRAAFKFVAMGGQFLSPRQAYERHARFAPEERTQILKAIKSLKIEGVVFLTGDVHYAELTKQTDEDAYPLFEITSSPLSAGPSGQGGEANYLAVPDTYFNQRNFAKLSVTGKRNERILQVELFDSNGQRKWEHRIAAADLRFKQR